jgi:hypothetical protein
MPTENVPTPVTTTARRGAATAVVVDASGLSPLTAGLLVQAVDAATAAIFAMVGLDRSEIRRAAAALWAQ